MRRWEESIEINAPADKVFAYVSDFTRHGDWSSHGLQATKTTDGPVSVGTMYSTTQKLFGTQRESSTITTMNPPAEFAWDSTGALGRTHHWFALSQNGDVTTVSKGAELAAPTFLAKVTGFRLNIDIPRNLRSDLDKIKAHLEA